MELFGSLTSLPMAYHWVLAVIGDVLLLVTVYYMLGWRASRQGDAKTSGRADAGGGELPGSEDVSRTDFDELSQRVEVLSAADAAPGPDEVSRIDFDELSRRVEDLSAADPAPLPEDTGTWPKYWSSGSDLFLWRARGPDDTLQTIWNDGDAPMANEIFGRDALSRAWPALTEEQAESMIPHASRWTDEAILPLDSTVTHG